jgi:hypothetical protein
MPLRRAVAHAVSTGAEVAGFQPQVTVRVMLDPAGHRFCPYLDDQQGPMSARCRAKNRASRYLAEGERQDQGL